MTKHSGSVRAARRRSGSGGRKVRKPASKRVRSAASASVRRKTPVVGDRPRGSGSGIDVLARIVNERIRDVAAAKRAVPLRDLLRAAARRQHHSLMERLRRGATPRVIAEVKQCSPSAGPIRPDYDPAALALEYEAAGAVGVSVLTEPRYFKGGEQHLRAVRSAIGLPVLRKDFIVDSYQLAEAAAWGADVVLLIAAALDPEQCRTLCQDSRELGLEVIVEVHSLAEVAAAAACTDAIIGVNNRNLKTLKTDLRVAMDAVASLPDRRVCIAESGIRSAGDIVMLQTAGYRGFLIGESLLRESSPGRALVKLIGDVRQSGRTV